LNLEDSVWDCFNNTSNNEKEVNCLRDSMKSYLGISSFGENPNISSSNNHSPSFYYNTSYKVEAVCTGSTPEYCNNTSYKNAPSCQRPEGFRVKWRYPIFCENTSYKDAPSCKPRR
jgi:hypothetical protein